MKIQEVKICNFRNIALMNINLKDNVSIISGRNELGKSNALNAICWFLTGTILTDKWGSGENDIDSIIPIGATRGINPEVCLIMDTGTKYTKKYISQWSKDGSKVKGHTTEWYINDVLCKNETEFNDSIYPFLKYTPQLKTKDVNELRLFIDPLYALQKLDAKALRALLVDLGCSVSTEELYKQGFEDLRKYGDKYIGKWDVFRKDLKDQNKACTKEIESLQAKIETVASVDEFNPETVKKLNAEYEALIAKKATIQSGAANPDIAEFEKRMLEIKASVNAKVEENRKSREEKRALLEEQKRIEIEKLRNGINATVAPLKLELQKVQAEADKMQALITSYTTTSQAQSQMMQQYISLANKLNDKKTDLALKLDLVRSSEYKGMITCPICGSDFPASEEEQARFEAHKKEEIQSLIEEISKLEKDKENYKAEYTKAKELRNEANLSIEEAQLNYNACMDKVSKLTKEIEAAGETKPVTSQALDEIESKIAATTIPLDVTFEYTRIQEMKVKLDALKNADQAKIQDQINELNIQINELNNKISEEYVKQSKYNEKLEYEANLRATQAKLNDNEALLARCSLLIQTMISLINKKATEKTGLTFVMLEENLTNDGIKEVCYATIDGVPFKDVNTAKKIKYGVKFIEKLKEILGHNELPILADRLEGIDNLDSIKTMTKEQLICTRVTEGKEITIL